jgi:acyl carrier protein
MTLTQVEEMLIEIACNIQKLSGREPVNVDLNTRPVTDIPGFDSLNGVEVTVEVIDRIKLDLAFNNVFVDETKKKALTIQQAAARVQACLARAAR